MMHAVDAIRGLMEKRDTLVCAGIDPNPVLFPPEIHSATMSDTKKAKHFLHAYVDTVAPFVCAFKAQKAYFDVLPEGKTLLAEVIAYAQSEHETPVIVDCKVGDIGETMQAYCHAVFDQAGADGIVVNPYMGDDVFDALAGYPQKAVVVLVKTSNPGGAVVQDLALKGGQPLWHEVLKLTMQRWNANGNVIPVIASTQDVDLSSVRAAAGDDTLMLLAGMGAQGGDPQSLKPLLNSKKSGVFVNSSRGLMYPPRGSAASWEEAVRQAVIAMRDTLNAVRR